MALVWQTPPAVKGVLFSNLLEKISKEGIKAERIGAASLLERELNVGFSGGEKKRLEILQMAMLDPKIAILDETDSGLDIDALKIVSKGINAVASGKNAMILVTHYQRILNYVKPDKVHVMMNGKFVLSGGPELALELEDKGYDWLKAENQEKVEV